MPQKAYRVEHPISKVGPYNHMHTEQGVALSLREEALLCRLEDAHHPTVSPERPSMWRQLDHSQQVYTETVGAVCGCPTLDALREWFGPFLRDLLDIGFRLLEYEYEEAFHSSRGLPQMLFVPIGEPQEVTGW